MKPRKLPTASEIWNVAWVSILASATTLYLFVGPWWERALAAAGLVSLITLAATLVRAFVTIWRNAKKAGDDLPIRDLRGGLPLPHEEGPVQIQAGGPSEDGGSITLTAGNGGSDQRLGGEIVIRGGNSMPPARGGSITLTAGGKIH